MNIKILFMDVDGTLTDGGIFIGPNGEAFKRFNAKDGYGINNVLKQHKIIPAIVTGRKSRMLEIRCSELGIIDLIQDSKNKIASCSEILNKHGMTFGDAAFIGDDLNDLDVMKKVGCVGCPSDAVKEVVEIADFVSRKKGGEGAVRDFIDWIVQQMQ